MAGTVDDFLGEAKPADGIKVGYLPQEPQLDPRSDVLGNAMEGVAEKKAILDRYNEIAAELLRRDRRRDDGACRIRSTPRNLWDLDTQVEQALDALRCPPGDAEVTQAVGRREAPRGTDTPAAVEARHPAARRADQPSRRRKRRLARALPRRTTPAASFS